MKDLIDITSKHLPEISEHAEKRKPIDVAVADKEDLVQHAMFEYYTKIYSEYPEWTRVQYIKNVADKFNRPIDEIENLYVNFRWFSRAKRAIFDGKNGGVLSTDATESLDQMLLNTSLIATLGTRFITDYLKDANPALMTPKDVYKIGMLVVECVRITNEVKGGGTPGQQQGQVINFVINE